MTFVRISLKKGPKSREMQRWEWLLYADFDKRHGFIPRPWGDSSDPWSDCILAVDELGLVAAFRYSRQGDARDEIVAGGTWVRPDQRGKGLAQQLWAKSLRGVKWVGVTTISMGGRALVRRLRKEHPKVGFNTNR
jgi:hypothetical protein